MKLTDDSDMKRELTTPAARHFLNPIISTATAQTYNTVIIKSKLTN